MCVKQDRSITQTEFLNRAKDIHGMKYTYKNDYICMNEHITIKCSIHGDFLQKPRIHLKGSGCPKCKSSKGEDRISRYLESKDIKYIKNHRFHNCRYKKPLPFDFFIPSLNICIEYDGEQHFTGWFGIKDITKRKLKLTEQQMCDVLKDTFCTENGILLKRISYQDDMMVKMTEILNVN